MGKKTLRVGYIGDLEEPRLVEIEADGDGSFLTAMKGLVGGWIEHFDSPFFGRPTLVVNDSGLVDGLPPNRAVWATAEMAEAGYLSTLDYSHVAEEGELYGILFGPILAVSYDEDGEERDISDDEWAAVVREFGGYAGMLSGRQAALAVREGAIPRRER